MKKAKNEIESEADEVEGEKKRVIEGMLYHTILIVLNLNVYVEEWCFQCLLELSIRIYK